MRMVLFLSITVGILLVLSACVSVFDCFTAAAEARIGDVEDAYASSLDDISALSEPGYTTARQAIETRFAPAFEAYRSFRRCVEIENEICAMAEFERLQLAASLVSR